MKKKTPSEHGDCKRCGEPLVLRRLFVVNGQCWQCKGSMPIAFVDCEGLMLSPEDMTDMEIAKARELGANLQMNHSQVRSENYCSNTCPSCGVMTGSHYLHDFWNEADQQSGYETGVSCLNCLQEEENPPDSINPHG